MREDGPLRGLALYNWPENYSLSDHRDFLLSLVEDAKIDPTKLEFKIGKDKRKRATVRKNFSAKDAIKAAPPFENFDFCRPIGGNYLRLESDMSFSLASYGKSYGISHSPEVLTVKNIVRHVALFSGNMTPQYGFSTVMHDSEVVWLMGEPEPMECRRTRAIEPILSAAMRGAMQTIPLTGDSSISSKSMF